MSFVNLQISPDVLPTADALEWLPMADAYEREVRLQQWIIWLPIFLLSFLPVLITQIAFLLLVPALVLMLALSISRLVIKKTRLKGYALREHDIAYRSGLYWQKTVMLPFNRIQHVEVSSGPLQRKFGLASLKFFTAGGSGVDLKLDGLTSDRAEELRAFIIENCGALETE